MFHCLFLKLWLVHASINTAKALGICCLIFIILLKSGIGFIWKETCKTKESQRPRGPENTRALQNESFITVKKHRYSTSTFSKHFLITHCFIWYSKHFCRSGRTDMTIGNLSKISQEIIQLRLKQALRSHVHSPYFTSFHLI